MQKNSSVSGIVLFAKQSGRTSFSSLFTIKHALNTRKVGHTGTLDSFADGLLVVMIGSLTRLVPHITAFDKTYDAIISFGEETDTLDPFGNVIRKSECPEIKDLSKAIELWTGSIMQSPPSYSALHIDGKRASDLARKGDLVTLPKRPVKVYSAELIETRMVDSLVKYAHIRFSVSKGTYIRSLARDIAYSCGSVSHLIALRRLSVGNLSLKDASGYSFLEDFSLDTVLNNLPKSDISKTKKDEILERHLEDEVIQKIKPMSESLAVECGITPIHVMTQYERCFFFRTKT